MSQTPWLGVATVLFFKNKTKQKKETKEKRKDITI